MGKGRELNSPLLNHVDSAGDCSDEQKSRKKEETAVAAVIMPSESRLGRVRATVVRLGLVQGRVNQV